LRGVREPEALEIDEASILQQVMYDDIWNNDAYLQFMYDRIMLMKELLSARGSIYVHLDWHVGHYVKLVMDEVFGRGNFRNEIVWNKGFRGTESKSIYQHAHDVIFWYSRGENLVWNQPNQPYRDEDLKRYNKIDENGRRYASIKRWKTNGTVYYGKTYPKEEGKRIDDVISHVPIMAATASERTGFVTQKPSALLEIFVAASAARDSIMFDGFIGSGTSAFAAQKLGIRWIGCDINKGAIQMTSKRLQKLILDQIKKDKKAKQQELPRYYSFGVYQVNNYDLQLLKTEAVELATQHIGIQRIRTDTFFDGALGKSLVKIIDFNHPLTLLDLQLIQDELRKRPNEDRDITIVCLGKELAVDPQIEEWNKKHPVNKLKVIELKTDKKYGHFLVHKPAEAKVAIQRVSKGKAIVEIQEFISPTIIERLNIDSGLLKVKIPDFRCMIDTVLIDTNYDGKTFHIVYSDVPEKKDDLVKGKYEIEPPNQKAKVAIKIIDMLGEEVLLECKLK